MDMSFGRMALVVLVAMACAVPARAGGIAPFLRGLVLREVQISPESARFTKGPV